MWCLMSVFLLKHPKYDCVLHAVCHSKRCAFTTLLQVFCLLKKMPLKKYSCLSLQFFPCGICHNWKDSRKSLLRTVADKICQWKKWIPCPGNFYGKFAIEQKMCSRNLPQHCPQKIWKWKKFPFHVEFSLEKNINQIVINKIHAGCHCAVRQITEDIARRNRQNK